VSGAAGAGGLRRALWRLALAWAALLALMLTSLGSAYVPLGAWGNLAVGLVIAALKAGLVAVVFMRLRRAAAATRIAAGVALATLAALVALGFLDYATRRVERAPWQLPQQLEPIVPRARP
jgi:cytochrome c oxidase subunit 4